MRKLTALVAIASLLTPTLAFAREPVITPVTSETAKIRYVQGVPSVTVDDETGGVMVTPGPRQNGRQTFRIAIANDGTEPINFGVENIRATVGGVAVPVLTRQRLEEMAKSRAAWSMVGMAMLGGLAAAAAASNSTRTYNSTTVTPYGVYRSQTRIYDPSSAALGTAASAAGTGVAIAAIDNRLQTTIENLREDIVQTTTVDSGTSYGGVIVLDKIKLKGKTAKKQQPLILEFDAGDGRAPYRVEFSYQG